ncbi:MAG: glycosyltransferase family 2 protein [Marinilabiliales bacterium]|nr:MAG: glycosyltransferase family 2 protein [Marinilabiliales bacterium]
MVNISVVIIAFNEERDISRCLKSVVDIADEIVVVDSFSTDKTVEIAKSFGSKVITHEFNSYIDQKNYALKQAEYNIVLSLDADEELSKKLKNSILEVKKQGFDYDGYSMNRLTRIGDKWINHSGWYPDTKLRLFDKTKGKWAGLNPHDEFVYYDKSNIYKLNGDLLHHSFYSFEELKKQSDKFAKLGAKAYYKKGKKAPFLKIIFNPALRFIRDYFFNKGFLHGINGIRVSYNNSHSTYLKYKYLHAFYTEKQDEKEN